MRKHKISQLIGIFLISLICFGFALKTEKKVLNNTNATSGSYKILVTYPFGISKTEKANRRQCVASAIGTYIINTETCESNPEGEILTLGHKVILGPTTGGNRLPEDDEDESRAPHDISNIGEITLTNYQIMQITNSCEILILTDMYDCNDLSDFKTNLSHPKTRI